jgi:uncharacterized protein (TIGR00255 family)
MTGFGKGFAENSSKRFTIELKSLNSKQLDLSSRIPSAYRSIELDLRNTIAATVERGKIDFSLFSESISDESDVTINVKRLAAYKRQVEQMAQELGIAKPDDWYNVLMRFPDVFHTDNSADVSDDDLEAINRALAEALKSLCEFRAKEGKKLKEFFTVRINRIRDLLAQIPAYEAERLTKIRSRIVDALEKIPQADYDRGRFEQEMIFYIEKLDINEEKQRLTQHLDYFLETMETVGQGQGKKLGFISQEMGREINTLGSKSNHAEMQIIVVKMKDELEQIKEQVLNVL